MDTKEWAGTIACCHSSLLILQPYGNTSQMMAIATCAVMISDDHSQVSCVTLLVQAAITRCHCNSKTISREIGFDTDADL